MRLSSVWAVEYRRDSELVQIKQIWPPKHNGRTKVQLGDKNSTLKNTMLWPGTRCDTWRRACVCACIHVAYVWEHVRMYLNLFLLTCIHFCLRIKSQAPKLQLLSIFITSFRWLTLKRVAAVSPLFTQWIFDAFVNGFKLSHHRRKEMTAWFSEEMRNCLTHLTGREKGLCTSGCIAKKAAGELLVPGHLISPFNTKVVALNKKFKQLTKRKNEGFVAETVRH